MLQHSTLSLPDLISGGSPRYTSELIHCRWLLRPRISFKDICNQNNRETKTDICRTSSVQQFVAVIIHEMLFSCIPLAVAVSINIVAPQFHSREYITHTVRIVNVASHKPFTMPSFYQQFLLYLLIINPSESVLPVLHLAL